MSNDSRASRRGRGKKYERTCPYCGTVFQVRPDVAKERNFCTRRCYLEQTREEAAHTLESGYTADPDTGCWIWNACKSRNDYAMVNRNKQPIGAHRLMWERAHGPQPKGTNLHHTCETPACVNHRHLQLLAVGPHTSLHHARIFDADEIRRLRYEEGKKLREIADIFDTDTGTVSRIAPTYTKKRTVSEDQEAAIQARAAAGESNASIARDYNVSESTIGRIKNGKR